MSIQPHKIRPRTYWPLLNEPAFQRLAWGDEFDACSETGGAVADVENPREEARVLKPRVPVTEPAPEAGFALPAVCACVRVFVRVRSRSPARRRR